MGALVILAAHQRLDISLVASAGLGAERTQDGGGIAAIGAVCSLMAGRLPCS